MLQIAHKKLFSISFTQIIFSIQVFHSKNNLCKASCNTFEQNVNAYRKNVYSQNTKIQQKKKTICTNLLF